MCWALAFECALLANISTFGMRATRFFDKRHWPSLSSGVSCNELPSATTSPSTMQTDRMALETGVRSLIGAYTPTRATSGLTRDCIESHMCLLTVASSNQTLSSPVGPIGSLWNVLFVYGLEPWYAVDLSDIIARLHLQGKGIRSRRPFRASRHSW